MNARSASGRRYLPRLAGAVLLLGFRIVVGWALKTLLAPADVGIETEPYLTVIAEEGEVGSTMTLNAKVMWDREPLPASQHQGVVTSVSVNPAQLVGIGAELYRIDNKPVFLARGAVPMYRPIGAGTTGPDVAQLQEFLKETGHYSAGADGKAGSVTVAAITRWQKETGQEATGTVDMGTLIFAHALPARLEATAELSVGTTLSGGEELVSRVAPTPHVTIQTLPEQAALIPSGVPASLTIGDVEYPAMTGEHHTIDDGVHIAVTAPDGSVVCGDHCSELPIAGDTLLPTEIKLVPPETGIRIPVSAIHTAENGHTFVVDAQGTEIPVTVVQSAKGMALVDGLSAGNEIRIPSS